MERVILPDNIVEYLLNNFCYFDVESFGNEFCIKEIDGDSVDERESELKTIFRFTKTPEGWELQEVLE